MRPLATGAGCFQSIKPFQCDLQPRLQHVIMMMCAYIALLSTSEKDSKRPSDNPFSFALFSSISGPLLGLYLSAAIAAHIQIRQSTCHTGPPIILESEPVM